MRMFAQVGLLAYLWSLHAAAQPTTPLVVEAGEVRQIAARLHQFPSVHVKPGGTLVIQERSSRWTILWVAGDVRVEGRIVGRKCSRVASPADRTPDGKTIEHRYANEALGGRGGIGGTATVAGAGSQNGGIGADGTALYGGGGGSSGGVHIQGSATKLGSAGKSAVGWQGAPPADDGGYDSMGGDGGKVSQFPNGCPLMIYSGGTFSGAGAIDLQGEPGTNGQPGLGGVSSNRGLRGSGGGGGGGPGGEGGRLLIVAKAYETEPNPKLEGGIGGAPGAPGAFPNNAQPGKAGDTGGAGFADILLQDQWAAWQSPLLGL